MFPTSPKVELGLFVPGTRTAYKKVTLNPKHFNKSLVRSWFKGNDTTTLCLYFQHKLPDLVRATTDDRGKKYLREMHQLFCHSNKFMVKLYNCNLWINEAPRHVLMNALAGMLECFRKCAQMAFDQDICRFKLRPKFHMAGELLFGLQTDYLEGRETLNPLSYATQVDEDFVGRIATMSRHVSARTVHSRTLRRYRLALKACWD